MIQEFLMPFFLGPCLRDVRRVTESHEQSGSKWSPRPLNSGIKRLRMGDGKAANTIIGTEYRPVLIDFGGGCTMG